MFWISVMSQQVPALHWYLPQVSDHTLQAGVCPTPCPPPHCKLLSLFFFHISRLCKCCAYRLFPRPQSCRNVYLEATEVLLALFKGCGEESAESRRVARKLLIKLREKWKKERKAPLKGDGNEKKKWKKNDAACFCGGRCGVAMARCWGAGVSAAAWGGPNVTGNKWRRRSVSENELIAALNMDAQLRLVRLEAPDD